MHNATGSRQSDLASENKHRGANRSTKVAGKLKVLPEQPEHVAVKSPVLNDSRGADDDAAASGGESEDGDISSEDNDQEDAEVEVCAKRIRLEWNWQPAWITPVDIRYIIKSHSYQMEQLGEMLLDLQRKRRSPYLGWQHMQPQGKVFFLCISIRRTQLPTLVWLSSYRMNDLMKFFNARRNAYHANPKLIDDVIYTPYVYDIQAEHSDGQPPGVALTGDLLGIPELQRETPEDDDRTVKRKKRSFFDTTSHEAEIFLFQYGTVVIWGMSETQEKRFLASMLVYFLPEEPTFLILNFRKRFEIEKLGICSSLVTES